MQQNPKHMKLAELLVGRLFRVPEYQRAYAWENPSGRAYLERHRCRWRRKSLDQTRRQRSARSKRPLLLRKRKL